MDMFYIYSESTDVLSELIEFQVRARPLSELIEIPVRARISKEIDHSPHEDLLKKCPRTTLTRCTVGTVRAQHHVHQLRLTLVRTHQHI